MSDTPVVIREARLRSAYHLHLSMEAEVWYIAASFPIGEGAEWIPEPGPGRVLSDLHFEFRGGVEPEHRSPDARTRLEDHSNQ